MRITPADMRDKRTQIKKQINQKPKISFKNKMDDGGKNKSNVGYFEVWTPNEEGRQDARIPDKVLKIPGQYPVQSLNIARMVEIKNNCRGMHNNNSCRLYRSEDETQEHSKFCILQNSIFHF